jgi:large subunit ribosomal protein L32
MVQMKKRTKSETRGRRSHHALKAKTLVKCPQCGQMALPHTACAFCGTYKGRQVIKVKTAGAKTAKTVKPTKVAKPAVKKTASAKTTDKKTVKNK